MQSDKKEQSMFKSRLLSPPLSYEDLYTDMSEHDVITVNVKSFGAKGDGKTDDTLAIQKALNNANKVIVPKGVYMINAVLSLKMNSNQILEFEDDAEFVAITNSASAYTVISIENKENIKLINAKIKGERFSHTGAVGEWGACVRVISSRNILIENCYFSESWGDGLYIGASDKTMHSECEKLILKKVICSDNRRLGMALTAVRKMDIYDSVFKNTGGSSPESGIDIEPNDGFYCEDIKLYNCSMYNNNTSGFIASIVSKGIVRNIDLYDCEMSDNKFDGAELIGAINTCFLKCTFNRNRNGVNSYVNSIDTKIINSMISGNRVMGIRSYESNDTIVEGCSVINNSDNGVYFKGLRNKAKRNVISNNLKTGLLIDIGSEYSEADHNDILENVQSGIYITANYIKIFRNYIIGNAINTTSSNIEVYSQNTIVKHNEVKLGFGSAIYGLRLTSGRNNVVVYNDFSDSGLMNNMLILTQVDSVIHSNLDD